MMNNRIVKIGIFGLALFITLLFLYFFYKEQNNINSEKFFKQGMKFYQEENYQDAYYNFNLINKSSDYYTLALLKEFQCANKLQDNKTALIKLDLLQKRKTSEIIRPYILYNELKLNENTQKYSKNQLYKKYSYILLKYPQSDFAQASAFKIAKLIEKKDPLKSKEYYIKYIDFAPNGKYAQEALNSLQNLKDYLSNDELEIISKCYLKNENYKEANEILLKLNFEKNWYLLAQSYKGLKNNTLEQDVILRGLNLDYTSVEEKEISQAIDRLLKLNNSDKIQILQDLYLKYKDKASYPTITYKLAENLTSIRAIKLYELIMDNYPKSIWASNSLWEVFWYNFKQERYKLCNSLALKHQELYPNQKDAPRILYWHGRVLLKEHKNAQAKEKFNQIIQQYPTNYYAFLSIRQLKLSKANKLINKKQIQPYNIDNISKYLFDNDKTIKILLKYDDFETIDEFKINNDYIKSWIYNKKGMYAQSIKLVSDTIENENIKPAFDDYRLKLQYPIQYEDLINKYSQKYKISPYLFMSLIREESHFNKDAKSSVGALGLAQIMPATASHIKNMQITKETLLNPQENIKIGEKYFEYLTQHFKGNVYLAILSYNAGFGNVDKWINNPSISNGEIDVLIENIPFSETKNYIKKILSSYLAYQNIYSAKNRLL